MYCFSYEEFDCALRRINPTVALMAIDSLGAFYWDDIDNKRPIRMDTYMRNCLRNVRNIINIALAYTRCCDSSATFDKVDYIVRLNIIGSGDLFHATTIRENASISESMYVIRRNGIEWRNE